jgi:hypothetical protein
MLEDDWLAILFFLQSHGFVVVEAHRETGRITVSLLEDREREVLNLE